MAAAGQGSNARGPFSQEDYRHRCPTSSRRPGARDVDQRELQSDQPLMKHLVVEVTASGVTNTAAPARDNPA
jgi:hypothetical protein